MLTSFSKNDLDVNKHHLDVIVTLGHKINFLPKRGNWVIDYNKSRSIKELYF